MKLNNTGAEIYMPSGESFEDASAKTTHMAISAHQDDIEIMAYDGILKCYDCEDNSFFGVVVTNGSGSPRTGIYAEYTDEQMQMVRRDEQKKAAQIGKYCAQALLDYPSSDVKDPSNEEVSADIYNLLLAASPKIVYTHNLADKHSTHVATTIKVIKAIRKLPKEKRPEKLYGGEVWRGLDWMLDEDKTAFDVDKYPDLALDLLKVFDSQVSGGKRYDKATIGRRLANATYSASHATDISQSLSFAMDMTPLINDSSLDIKEYVLGYINRFKDAVASEVDKFSK